MLTSRQWHEFYSVCETCGRTGHEGVWTAWPGDVQCVSCLPLRVRVALDEASAILDAWRTAQGAA